MKDLELMSQSEVNFEFFNKFSLDMNAFGFGDIIDLMEQNCDAFVSEELLLEIGGLREDGEIDENQFRERIERDFLLISVEGRKTCNYHDNEVLKATILFFTVITSLAYSVLDSNLFSLVWQ
jgi:hypothetical protein